MAKYESVIRYDDDFNINIVLKNGGEVVNSRIIASHSIVDLVPVKQLTQASKSGVRLAVHQTKKTFPTSGLDLLREIMSDGQVHDTLEIRSVFLRKGFSGNGSSPRIHQLLTLGEIKRVADHKYQATPKLLKFKHG